MKKTFLSICLLILTLALYLPFAKAQGQEAGVAPAANGAAFTATAASASEAEQRAAFLEYMNGKAAALGMENTTFRDAYGGDNTTTAHDLLRLMIHAAGTPKLMKIWESRSYTVSVGGPNAREKTVESTVIQPDLENHYHILGGKTGTWGSRGIRNLTAILQIPDSDDRLIVVMLYANGKDNNEATGRFGVVRRIADAAMRAYLNPEAEPENPDMSCRSAIACVLPADGSPVRILYEKNPDEVLYPMSITKVMTALCVLETIGNEAGELAFFNEDTRIGDFYEGDYAEGDTLSLTDAMYAMLLPSSNVTAQALARRAGALILEEGLEPQPAQDPLDPQEPDEPEEPVWLGTTLDYDATLEDGALKVLLIGNGLSEDVAEGPLYQSTSRLYEMLRNVYPDKPIVLGLLYSQEKSMAWYYLKARRNEAVGSLAVISEEGDGQLAIWRRNRTAVTVAEAMRWTNWDVISLQPSQSESLTGLGGTSGEELIAIQYELEESLGYLLHVARENAPQAQTVLLAPWSASVYAELDTGAEDWARTVQVLMETPYYGKVRAQMGGGDYEMTGERFAAVIPCGTAIQNARSSYLALLQHNPGIKTVNLETDPVVGLLRDGCFAAFNHGRYLLALTCAKVLTGRNAETLMKDIPLTCPDSSMKALPEDYARMIRISVNSAVELPFVASLVPDYDAVDPARHAAWILEGAATDVHACEKEDLRKALLNALTLRLSEECGKWPEIVAEDVEISECAEDWYRAKATLSYGYALEEANVGGSLAWGHVWSRWMLMVEPTCTEKGMESHYCVYCHATEFREIKARGHELIHHEGRKPTATEPGWEPYDTCAVCDYTTYQEIPPLGCKIKVKDFTNGAAVTSLDPEEGYLGELRFTVDCEAACVVAMVVRTGDNDAENENGLNLLKGLIRAIHPEDAEDDKPTVQYFALSCELIDGVPTFSLTVEADVEMAIALRGDANLDGTVGTKDATAIRKIVARVSGIEEQLSDWELAQLAADANADGAVGTKDATLVRKVVARVPEAELPW